MKEYNFQEIEKKWQQYWQQNNIYKVDIDPARPKYYVLDMFPYPSGAGLHVGHPLGYIASDICARYKKHCGYNVLHPMGYDAFGLPAEQYAIQTGQHPAITTENNIRRYRSQLEKIGFSYDWSREIRTCDPSYYKWTQWAFILMFHHYYNNKTRRAEPIEQLIAEFEKHGNLQVNAASGPVRSFTAEEWKSFPEDEKLNILMEYRIAYLGSAMVNWCPALGTVLANDEVKDGISIRGGHPVEQRKMKQWQLRVSAYAQRLLDGLDQIDWPEPVKEIQRNWIGRSEGAEIFFPLDKNPAGEKTMIIFTTRPDTIFGVTFMVLAPESEWVEKLTAPGQKKEVEKYLEEVKKHTERERIAETGRISGVFCGTYAIHPFTGKKIPIYISEYVLAGYGTGAIMAVPAHDSRDYVFARCFNLPIIPLIEGCDISHQSFDAKEGIMINSEFLNGLDVKDAIHRAIEEVEKRGIGRRKVNYRLRDAIFSRQRYWGEPFPVYYKNGQPYTLDLSQLPLTLPEVDKYLPTETGEPPLGRAKNWHTPEGYKYELSTMPGFAGSSAYYLRYMDPHNDKALVSTEANLYWQNVDLYIGGTEHATGHLIYARFWNKFLYDLGYVCQDEPFKKLVNQGMIQGRSNFVYRIKGTNTFVTLSKKDQYDHIPIHVDVNIVENDVLDIEAFRKWNPEYLHAEFILEEDGRYICGWAIEKMSKSMFNVVNPDTIIEKYGADTLRMYEMFLGPLEQSKPWDTKGIDGVYRFLKKLWRLFYDEQGNWRVSSEKPTSSELRILHKTIKKITTDIESFSFNTAVSQLMICVNELTDMKCFKEEILEPLLILLSPFAPHIAEELWHQLGNNTTICDAPFPEWNEEYLTETTFEYPVSFNGKVRYKLPLPLSMSVSEIENTVLRHENTRKYLQQKQPKKIIVVPGKIINIVV